MRSPKNETLRVYGDIFPPRKEGDVGYDLAINHGFFIPNEAYGTVELNVVVEMPSHLFALVLPRSSMNIRGLFAITGVIDSGYRGKIKIVILNKSGALYRANAGDRVAQLVFFPAIRPILEYVNSPDMLSESERGTSGFGSTNERGS